MLRISRFAVISEPIILHSVRFSYYKPNILIAVAGKIKSKSGPD
jgi:hypothetical protein